MLSKRADDLKIAHPRSSTCTQTDKDMQHWGVNVKELEHRCKELGVVHMRRSVSSVLLLLIVLLTPLHVLYRLFTSCPPHPPHPDGLTCPAPPLPLLLGARF